MSWVAAAGLAIGVGSSLYQGYQAYKQGERADELAAKNGARPMMPIAQGYTDALESAKAQAKLTRLPGQSAIEGRLDQTTANQISMLDRSSLGGADMINAAGRVYGNQQAKENELGVQAAGMRLHNQDILRNEEHNMGAQQNLQFDTNQLQPWKDNAAAIAALREGSMRNMNSALKNVFGSVGLGVQGMLTQKDSGNAAWWEQYSNNDPNTNGVSNAVNAPPDKSLLDSFLGGEISTGRAKGTI